MSNRHREGRRELERRGPDFRGLACDSLPGLLSGTTAIANGGKRARIEADALDDHPHEFRSAAADAPAPGQLHQASRQRIKTMNMLTK